MGERAGRTRVRPISSAKKQLNITDSILIVNGNQRYRTGNVRVEILPTAKPFGIFGEESSGRRIVVSGAIVICSVCGKIGHEIDSKPGHPPIGRHYSFVILGIGRKKHSS